MGREQRRREQFKNKNKKVEEKELDTSIKGITIIKLVSFVAIFLFVIYYVLAIFVTKEIDISNGSSKTKEEEKTTTSTIDNRILASNIFSQKEDEYYVYFYDFNDEEESVSSVISSLSEEKVYKVDTSSSLNQKYVTTEKGNKSATTIEELKIKNPTVIKIKADKTVEYYEGSSAIYDALSK